MRVLFLNPIAEIGGAERVLLTAIKGIRETSPRSEIHVLAAGDGPLLERVRALGAGAPRYLCLRRSAGWEIALRGDAIARPCSRASQPRLPPRCDLRFAFVGTLRVGRPMSCIPTG